MAAINPPLEQNQRQVEEMLLDGRPFPRIEREIESKQLADDDKAALWLYAWSLDERMKRSPTLPLTRPHLTSV